MTKTLCSAVLITSAMCGSVLAQDAESESARVYEHLKVLESLVGDYSAEFENRDGQKMQFRISASWTPRKQMMV